MTVRHTIRCPQCSRVTLQATGNIPLEFGDPRSTCPHCGAQYFNPWIIELAYLPKEWYEKNHRRFWIMLLLFLLPPAMFPFILRLPENMIGYGVVALMILWAVSISFYQKKTSRISVKDERFDRQYRASERRLSDPEYKKILSESGYIKEMMATIMS